jgi:hypothetical protein
MADDFNMDAFMKAANAINPPSLPGKAAANDFNMDAFSRAINAPDDPWTALGATPAQMEEFFHAKYGKEYRQGLSRYFTTYGEQKEP